MLGLGIGLGLGLGLGLGGVGLGVVGLGFALLSPRGHFNGVSPIPSVSQGRAGRALHVIHVVHNILEKTCTYLDIQTTTRSQSKWTPLVLKKKISLAREYVFTLSSFCCTQDRLSLSLFC